jgi:hypothetical protein
MKLSEVDEMHWHIARAAFLVAFNLIVFVVLFYVGR